MGELQFVASLGYKQCSMLSLNGNEKGGEEGAWMKVFVQAISEEVKSFRVLRLGVSISVIPLQCEFRAGFKRHYSYVLRLFQTCTELTLHCNHRSELLKTEHTESLLLLRRHLGNWPRGPAVSMRSELLVAQDTLDSSRCSQRMLCPWRARNTLQKFINLHRTQLQSYLFIYFIFIFNLNHTTCFGPSSGHPQV
jgi:hypothetical protein